MSHRTNRDHIPFFDDAMTDAVRAIVAKLWDEARRPVFNSHQAYADFTGAVGDEGVAAPARPIYKRWIAGVQGGMVSRPGGPAPSTAADEEDAPAPDLFEGRGVPLAVLPCVQSAWDRASQDGFTEQFIFSALCRDLSGSGYPEPSLTDFRNWLKAVRAGKIVRPGKVEAKAAQEEASVPFVKLTPTVFGEASALDALKARKYLPSLDTSVPDPTLVLIRDRMVEEEIARLTVNARAQAEVNVAARFRTIAATLQVDGTDIALTRGELADAIHQADAKRRRQAY